MKYPISQLIILIAFAAASCQRKSTPASNTDVILSISTVCGWCTGGDSLVINASQSVYQYSPSCDPAQAATTTAATDKKIWNELLSLFDKTQFEKININLCNVCADGCDVRVTVKDKNYIHSISYGGSDNQAVSAVRPFLEKLEALSAVYKKEFKK
ncbi:hypothetical protein U0035_03145 [Niabella yanshanensis]|uniref:Uncharacterized protein n=1 Tax=Niabella yanshanensis TaxID=577386 RepID=A0ABZ0W785_9BACT|nr:hypothetical protein [Niabella yanshanensis]WQD39143.1 hypothetical protein U0035_03145 [Niabella yanshanensis]